MFEDHIVNEVREIRRKHSERFDNDLDKIVSALQIREQKIENLVQPRTPKPSQTAGHTQ